MAPGIVQAFGMDEAGLRQLTVPTYITVGAGDTQAPPKDNAEFAARHIPHAELYVIPGRVDHASAARTEGMNFRKPASTLPASTAARSMHRSATPPARR